MKIFRTVLAAIVATLIAGTALGAAVADRIVAVVNDEVITLVELNRAFEPFEKNIDANYKGNDKEAVMKQNKGVLLQRMVDQVLIEQEAKKAGKTFTTVKDEEVMEVLRDMLTRNKVSMDEYRRKLAAEGNTMEAVKKEIRGQMMRMRLLRMEVQSKIVVADEEIGAYYNKHLQEYEGKEAVYIKQILLPAPANMSPKEREQARELAQSLRQRVVKGESFEALAAEYSKGPAAAQGGDIGFVERGVILPAVEKAVFNLSKGQLSDVIESELGFHLVAIMDKRGAGLKPLPEVRNEIKSKIEEEKLAKKYDEWIDGIRKKSFIDIRL